MTSGVDWVEDHRDPASAASRLIACFGADGGDSRALLARVGPRSAPGTRYEYCTADSQVLDWVRERATGASYDVALGALWRTLGCTVGRLRRHRRCRRPDGRRQPRRDRPRLGPDRAARSSTAPSPASRCSTRTGSHRSTRAAVPVPATGPAAQQHHHPRRLRLALVAAGRPPGGARPPTAAAASSPTSTATSTSVVVKTSQWPYDDVLADRQYRDLSYLGLPAVALAASRL